MAGKEQYADSRNLGIFGQFAAEPPLLLGNNTGLSRPSPHANMYGAAGYGKLQQKAHMQATGLKQLKRTAAQHSNTTHGDSSAFKNSKDLRNFVQDDEAEVQTETYRPISRFARDHIEMVKDWSNKIEKLKGKALRGQRVSESFRHRLDNKLEELSQRFCEAKDWFAEEFSQMLCDELSGESNLRKAVTNLLAFSLKEDVKPNRISKNSNEDFEPTMLGKRFVLEDQEEELEVTPILKEKKDYWETTKPIWKPKNSWNQLDNFDHPSKDEKLVNSAQSLTIRIPDVGLDPLTPSKGARQLISKALEQSIRKDDSTDSMKARNTIGNLISARKSSGPLQGKNLLSSGVPLPEVPLDPPKPSLPLTTFEFSPAQSRLSANSPCSHKHSTTLGVPVKPTTEVATKTLMRDLFTKRIREYIVDGGFAGKILGETRCVLPYPKGMWTVILNDRIMAQFVPEAIRSKEGQEIKPILDIDPTRFGHVNSGLVVCGEQQNIRSGTGGTSSVPTGQCSQLSNWVLTPPQLRIYDETQPSEFTVANGLLQMASLSRFLDQLFKQDGKYCLVKSDGGDLVYIGSSAKIFVIDIRVLDPVTNQIIPELLLDLEGPELQDFDVISLPNGGFRVAYLSSIEDNMLFVATIPPKPAASSSETGSNSVSQCQQIAISSPDVLSAPAQSGSGTEQASSIVASDSVSKIDPEAVAAASPLSVSQSMPISGVAEGLSSEAKIDNPSPQPSEEVEIITRPRWYKLEEAEFLDKDLNIGFSSEMSKDFNIKFRKVLFIDESILTVGVARVNSKVERIQYMDNAFLKVSKSRIKFKKILSALCPMYRPATENSKQRDYQNVDVDVISVVNPTPLIRFDPSPNQATKSLGKSLSKLKFIQHLDLENNFRALFPVPDFSSCLESDSEHEQIVDIVESEVSVFWEDTPGLLEIAAIPTTGDIFITSEDGKFYLLTAGCPKQIQKDLSLIQAKAAPAPTSRTGTADKERKSQQTRILPEAAIMPPDEARLTTSPTRTAPQEQPLGLPIAN